ncbi:MAG: hypothetical protein WCF57_22385 [Pyrinomonadaceae bacterium]
MNSRKCAHCGLVNFATEEICRRCGALLADTGEPTGGIEDADDGRKRSIWKRALAVLCVTGFLLLIFYLSLLSTSEHVPFEQKQLVYQAINVLERSGFGTETFALRHLVNYRATDNWWNTSVGHKEAYAATNFPFEVITLYPEFFSDSTDDVERAAILLHECYHLRGSGEAAALEGVWRDKRRLGWTADKYGHTKVWENTRDLTVNLVPQLFRCGPEGRADCIP